MDKQAQALLDAVKEVVKVPDGENPMRNKRDALNLATREGVLYRYAQNGARYDLRWNKEMAPFSVQAGHLCAVICKRIVDVKAVSDLLAPDEPDLEVEEVSDAPEEVEEAEEGAEEEAADEPEEEEAEEPVEEEAEESEESASVDEDE